MTRLASTAKAGFFPTPERVTGIIARLVAPAKSGGKLLDPCCGAGVAAQTVADGWHLESYGIEIDAERALEASGCLHRVLHLDYGSARMPHHAFQVLYLNPPYDTAEGEGKRMEYQFLRDATKWLQPGGLLIYIVPQYRVDARMAGFLAAAYESIRAYRFPDPEYGDFRQAVLFGVAKKEPVRDEAAALALLQQCRGTLPVLPDEFDSEHAYRIPEPADIKFYFRGTEINPQEALAEAISAGAWKTPEWQEWMVPSRELDGFRPLMPLKKGHLAMLIAAGLMQNLHLESADGSESLLVKGRTYKVQEKVESGDEDEEVVRDRFVTEIVALNLKDGSYRKITDAADLAEFVDKWRDALAQKVMQTFVPLYRFDLEAEGPQVQAILGRLSKHRRVPGRKETGLFAAQKHVAVALWKRLQTASSAICVGEPGVGKCLAPESRVQVNGELLTMQEIWTLFADPTTERFDGEGFWCEPKQPMCVPTFDETTGKIRLGRVNRLYRQEINEPIKDVQLVEGKRVRATTSHPFLTPGGWTTQIATDDYVAVPTRLPAPQTPYLELIQPDFLAWQIAEGHEERKTYCVEIHQKDRGVLARLLKQTEAFSRIPGYESHPTIRNYAYHHCAFLELASKAYVRYLVERGYSWGELSAGKSIPPFVMTANTDAAQLFLQAYCDAESSVTNRGVEIMTASEKMAHQLVELLLRFGITASFHAKVSFATNSRCPKPRTYYRVTITGIAARLYRDGVGFTYAGKQRRLEAVCARGTRSNIQTIYISDVIALLRATCDFGRKISANLIGGDQLRGRKRTMNRSSAENLKQFIESLETGRLREYYAGISHRQYKDICRRLDRVDRSSLEKAHSLLDRRLKPEIRFARVANVQYALYQGFVYDLEVEGTHNFVANQILVHNTTIGSAVAELLRQTDKDCRPTLVLCPPHLVAKWVREIQQIVPLAFAMPLYRLSDLTQFVRQVQRLDPMTPCFAVLSREMAKLGSGWRPAYVIQKHYGRAQRAEDAGSSPVETEELFACPRCGSLLYEVEGGHEVALVRHASYLSERKRFCSRCGEPLFQMVHLNGAALQTGPWLFDADARPSSQRYPIAEFIARRYRGFFKLLVADEVHQMKAQSTDQGYALGALVRACGKTLALTGTIYGGRATSLFFLLHRLSPAVRAQYKWSDGQRWAERYGILEKVMKRTEGDDGFGTYSGKRRRQTYVRELPGASPELAAMLLDSSAFLNLGDLGFQLPDYHEYPHVIPMADDQRQAYAALEEELMEELMERLQAGDHSLLGAYLQSLLAYPNSCFREEVVEDSEGVVVASAPGLGEDRLYPKEEWLVELARRERDRGRRVLVYCRQTGTRDITGRLATILGGAGLRADVLKASVGTQVREEWLRRRVGKGMIDVLITNPKLVETGLDLIDFQTTVWLETEYSLYTLMQASRRTWRIGQTHAVEVHFAIYRDTMEHRAASLVGQKLAAAQLLYGDSVEGALVDQADSGHGFLADLARSVIERSEVPDLTHLFRQVSMGRGNGHAAAEFISETAPVALADVAEIAVGADAATGGVALSAMASSARQIALF